MPNEGDLVETDFVGLQHELAYAKAKQCGWAVIRVYTRGDVITADLCRHRLNLVLDDNGIVIEAHVS